VTRQLVAKVVGILYLTTGREVTHEAIDAWAVALADTPDGDDVLEVAAQVARDTDFATLAQFFKALIAPRRRRALEAQAAAWALPSGDVHAYELSHPANWAAFRAGARREAMRLGRPTPQLPEEPPAGISLARIVDAMRRPPEPADPAEAWNGGGDPEAAA
jgi:hypothetical protein